MLTVFFWIALALLLLTAAPDPWDARREIAKREGLVSVLRGSQVTIERIFAVNNGVLARAYLNKGTWQ